MLGPTGQSFADVQSQSQTKYLYSEDAITFSEVDIVNPAQKMLTHKLTCEVFPGKSLLVTG